MSTIHSIFGPDKSDHAYVPTTSFTPINTDNSFVATARKTAGPKKQSAPPETHSYCLTNSAPQLFHTINKDTSWECTYFIATVDQLQAAESEKRPKVSNLWGFVTVLHDQIRRTITNSEIARYRPSIGEIRYAVDKLRDQVDEAKLTKDWQYEFVLFGLLDRTAQLSFRTFSKFEDREGSGRDPGFHLIADFNPYGTLINERLPKLEPYLTASYLPTFLQQVHDFNQYRPAYTIPRHVASRSARSEATGASSPQASGSTDTPSSAAPAQASNSTEQQISRSTTSPLSSAPTDQTTEASDVNPFAIVSAQPKR